MAKKTQKTVEPNTGPTCTVPDCDKPVYVRRLCENHWNDPRA